MNPGVFRPLRRRKACLREIPKKRPREKLGAFYPSVFGNIFSFFRRKSLLHQAMDYKNAVMNLRFRRTSLSIGIFSCVAVLCRADVAFSDLSATSPYYDTNGGYLVEGSTIFLGSSTIGAQFTSTLSGNISSVLLGLSLSPFGGDGSVNVYLEPVPSTPGLVNLNTAILLGPATTTTPFGDGSQLTSVTLIPGLISLSANQDYCLILQPSDPNTGTLWNLNNTSTTGNVFISGDGGVTFTPTGGNDLPAFQIELASVPEPSSLWVGVAAVIGALILRRRQRTGIAAPPR